MTSQINTNGIDANYPVPGQNNSSQGFRDNFSQIKTQLNTGATEITDLQNKVLLKSALTGGTLNNDMANALISNASTSGFRSTTYNLGNALAGTVLIDVNRADVQYGAIASNVVLQFTGWSPINTQSNVVLRLTYANANASISLPSSCISSNNNFGVTLLENYANVANVATLTVPANTSIVEYRFSSLDCGNTVSVEPTNRPYQATQVVNRVVPPTGIPGDVEGDIAVGSSLDQVTVSSTIGTGNFVVVNTTTGFFPDMSIVFTGNTDSSNSNIVAGTTYYVKTVANSTAFTVSTSAGGAAFDVGTSAVTFYGNPESYLYLCTNSFNSNTYTKTVSNTYTSTNQIKVNNTANLAVNSPIIFTGNVFGGLTANTVYYVKTIDSGNSNISVAYSRSFGVAGTQVALSTANGTMTATCYTEGNDIWKRISTQSW